LSPESEEYRKMQTSDDIFVPMWINMSEVINLKQYQLEIRDLLLHDYKDGFKEETKKLFLNFSERRQ